MPLVTARITIGLPFRTIQKEGELYDIIEIKLDDGGMIKIYPLEDNNKRNKPNNKTYINKFRKLTIDTTLPVDSLQIDFSKHDVWIPFMDVSSRYINDFLQHCRTKTHQYWFHSIFLNGFNLSQIWFAIQFFETNSEKMIFEMRGSTGGTGFMGVGLNREIWDKIKDDLANGVRPHIVDFYLEEARDVLFEEKSDILVVNTAIAMEIFSSRFCFKYAQQSGKDTDHNFLNLLSHSWGGIIDKNFGKLVPFLTNRELKSEDADKYDAMDYLFRTRNNIVHKGEMFYKDKYQNKIIVGPAEASLFFRETLAVMEWLKNIDNNIANQIRYFPVDDPGRMDSITTAGVQLIGKS